MLPALAGIHANLAILIYPQRTLKTLKITGLVASIINITLLFRREWPEGLK